MNHKHSVDISIIITAHAEGILLHKTLGSIDRAVELLDKSAISYEIILHVDNETKAMKEYLSQQAFLDRSITVYKNSFGDLGSSRNFAVSKARGTFIAFIDADDLMSQNWLQDGYQFLNTHTIGKYVAHAEMTIEFGDANSVIQKYGEINKETDTLLNVYSARWNSVIMAPRDMLSNLPYPKNDPGFGYEDWYLSCSFIEHDIHNVLIPNTVIFVRRKTTGSEWARQKVSRSVLHAHPLLSFDTFRNINIQNNDNFVTLPPKKIKKIKDAIKPIVTQNVFIESYSRKAFSTARKVYHHLKHTIPDTINSDTIPTWLIDEWQDIHTIEKELFPMPEYLSAKNVYHTITPDHYWVGEAYKKLVDNTRYNTYSYIIFVPWLMKGGGDLYAINYANRIAELSNSSVLVVATNTGNDSPWSSKLNDKVDFLPFGTIAGHLPIDHQYRILEQLIENSHANILHILNSELGYDFLLSHQTYLSGSNKKVVATSFSQSTDSTGRIFGFSHTHIPKVYDLVDLITTDNQAVASMWQSEYGFNPGKILVHRQPIYPNNKLPHITHSSNQLKILWASRLSPEKQPSIVPEIGRLLADDKDITIDMFGTVDKGFDISFLDNLPDNVHYKGSFDGFESLPLSDYNVYLYTTLFDGMPNILLEMTQVKLPIVSSSIGGIPEFITSGENGLLVANTSSPEAYVDALKTLKDPVARKLFADNATQALEDKFSPKRYDDDIVSMLKRLGYDNPRD